MAGQPNARVAEFGKFGLGLVVAVVSGFFVWSLSSNLQRPTDDLGRFRDDATNAHDRFEAELSETSERLAQVREQLAALKGQVERLDALSASLSGEAAKGQRWTYEQQVEYSKRIDGDVAELYRRLDRVVTALNQVQ